MAMNPKDLELRSGERVPKAKPGSTPGPGWLDKRRDRRMTHEALHRALANFAKARTT